tara:strand:- start:181 stop:1023 length:843 start_codon:yes stop_codon:yes gene_type:complete
MNKKQTKTILKIIVVLSILGFFTSLYLTYNHYSPPVSGALCDFSESISCSLVNTSSFSILLNIPVALLGAIWFLFLGAISWKAIKNESLFSLLLIWNVFGILFVIYFIIAEVILKALCPLCTVVHVIVLITFILSFLLYKQLSKQQRRFNFRKLIKKFKPWIVAIVIINLIPLIVFNFPGGEQEDHTQLAKCITERGVNMYGSFRCGVCAKTRALFGDAFQYINEIECHPQGEDSQWELCQEKALEGTPTWILEPNGEEIKRETGFLSIEELKEFSGCIE